MSSTISGLAELRFLVAEASGARGIPVVAFVGAGGKTSSMFALARSFAFSGSRVLVTTTTRIYDPGTASEREGRGFGTVLVLSDPSSSASIERIRSEGPRVVLGSGVDEKHKLRGINPESISALARFFDLVLVEADGARGLSIKAPSHFEPVVPPACSSVVGLIGLDAIGAPMDGRTVFRPELFGPLVSCAPGEAISIEHARRLVSSSLGLFKGTPDGARRITLLNKADAVPPALAKACASAIVASRATDAVVVGAFGASIPGGSP